MKKMYQKPKCLRASILTLAAGGLALMSACVVQPNGQVGVWLPTVQFAPPVVVAPAVEVGPVFVPEAYTWDGVEYVGLVGDQYFYLGQGDVWLVAGPDRLARFHGWESGHPDWRNHATRNDRFRKDAHGHVQPRRNDKRG